MIRVGHILRNEDLHGVSGTGKVAEIIEFSNGICVVSWISAHSSTNFYNCVKDVLSVHSHSGRSLVIWDWESPDLDPMDALKEDDTPKVELNEEELTEIAEEAAEGAKAAIAEKIVKKMAEASEAEDGQKTTSNRAASAASKILRDPKTSKKAKTAAGKALTQKIGKKKPE